MEPEVEAIMMENMNKNHIDVEYVMRLFFSRLILGKGGMLRLKLMLLRRGTIENTQERLN